MLPLLGGPHNAERSSLDGHQTGGGLGKPLGRGEGELVSLLNRSGDGQSGSDGEGRGEGELRLQVHRSGLATRCTFLGVGDIPHGQPEARGR